VAMVTTVGVPAHHQKSIKNAAASRLAGRRWRVGTVRTSPVTASLLHFYLFSFIFLFRPLPCLVRSSKVPPVDVSASILLTMTSRSSHPALWPPTAERPCLIILVSVLRVDYDCWRFPPPQEGRQKNGSKENRGSRGVSSSVDAGGFPPWSFVGRISRTASFREWLHRLLGGV